jgi:hypothetical protein
VLPTIDRIASTGASDSVLHCSGRAIGMDVPETWLSESEPEESDVQLESKFLKSNSIKSELALAGGVVGFEAGKFESGSEAGAKPAC